MENKPFTPAKIGLVELRNRTIRSAAFEGMGRDNGQSTDASRLSHISGKRGSWNDNVSVCRHKSFRAVVQDAVVAAAGDCRSIAGDNRRHT